MPGPITRSQFTPFQTRELRSVFYETGRERPNEYGMVLNVSSMDWNPVTDRQVAGIGTMPDKPEGSRFVLDAHRLGGTKSYEATPKGLAIEFSWESWRDELYGVARELVKEMKRATRQRQEVDGWSIFNDAFDSTVSGFTSGEALCGAHVGLDGVTRRNAPTSPIGASVTYFQDALTRFETLTDESGNPRLLQPIMAIGTPTNKFTLREILGSSGKVVSADNELNALIAEDLSWMISHWLNVQTNIFLITNKANHDLNFLWRDKPMFDSFDDPWTKNAIFTAYQRFTQGWERGEVLTVPLVGHKGAVMLRRVTIALALTVLVGVSPSLAQTSTPTGSPTATPTLQAKRPAHGETNFAAMQVGSFQLNPPSITGGTSGFFDVNLPGIQKGDMIVVYPPADLESALIYSGTRILTNNVLSIRLTAAGTTDGTAKTWEYVWWDRTSDKQPNPTPVLQNTLTPTATPTNTNTSTPTATNTP